MAIRGTRPLSDPPTHSSAVSRAMLVSGFALVGLLWGTPASSEPAAVSPETIARDVIDDAVAPLIAARGAKATIVVNAGDVRRNLAPCARAVGFFPPGAKPIGKTLVSVRCVDGATWQAFVAADVRLEAPVWQATRALRAGDIVTATDVIQAQAPLTVADLDTTRGLATLDGRTAAPVGRILLHATGNGRALTRADLKDAGRINPGDPVRVTVRGNGFSVSSDGRAVGAADPGSNLLVRLASGSLVNGTLRDDHRVELSQ